MLVFMSACVCACVRKTACLGVKCRMNTWRKTGHPSNTFGNYRHLGGISMHPQVTQWGRWVQGVSRVIM